MAIASRSGESEIRCRCRATGWKTLLAVISELQWSVLVVLGIAALGGVLFWRIGRKRRRSVQDSFAAYLQYSSERERAAIARELHDEVGGILAAAKIELDVIGRLIPEGTAAVHGRLKRLSGALDAGLAVERRLVERLRPSALDHLGLYVALRWQATERCTQAGRKCAVTVLGVEPSYVPDQAVVVLRAVEDALAHALVQPGVTIVEFEVQTVDQCLEVLMQDDGSAVPATAESKDARSRIWAAGRRADILGGECLVSARRPHGTKVLLRFPIAILERNAEWSGGD